MHRSLVRDLSCAPIFRPRFITGIDIYLSFLPPLIHSCIPRERKSNDNKLYVYIRNNHIEESSRWVKIDSLHTNKMFSCNRNGNEENASRIALSVLYSEWMHLWPPLVPWYINGHHKTRKSSWADHSYLVCVIKGIMVSLLPCLTKRGHETWWYRRRWRSRKGSLVAKISIDGCDV
jgi:hypothetical protein